MFCESVSFSLTRSASVKYKGALVLLSAIFLLLEMRYVGGWTATLYLIGSFVLFLVPGILFFKITFERSQVEFLHTKEEIFFLGSVIGVGLGCAVVAVVSRFLGFRPVYILVAGSLSVLIMLSIRAIVNRRIYSERGHFRRVENNHIMLLFVFLVAVGIALYVPYLSFGKLIRNELIFNNLQKTDLLHHMTTAIELAKGIPPQNPYFGGEYLHYYWLSHIFPAFIYALSSYRISPRDIIVLSAFLYSLLFVVALFLMLRKLFPDKRVLILLMIMSLFCYGYNYFLSSAKLALGWLPTGSLRDLLWSRLLVDDWGAEYTGYSHSWFRSFMVEPQVCLVMAVLFVYLLCAKRHSFFPQDRFAMLFQSVLLGISLLIDTFIGFIFITSYYVFVLIKCVFFREIKQIIKSFMILNCIILVSASFLLAFDMIKPGYGSLIFKPYKSLILLSPLYLIVDFGPIILPGVMGIVHTVQHKKWDDFSLFMFSLCGISLIFMFFVQYADVGTQICRKSGFTLRLCLVFFAGGVLSTLLSNLKSDGHLCRKKPCLFGLILLLVSFPTLLNDVYRISTFDKPDEKSYRVTLADYRAYMWMRENIPLGAIVQDMPKGITGIAAFGERRTALGDWVHAKDYQIGAKTVFRRHDDIRKNLFLGDNASGIIDVVNRYHIDYIFLGTEESRLMGYDAKHKFDFAPEIFQRIYRSREGVTIYQVKRGTSW